MAGHEGINDFSIPVTESCKVFSETAPSRGKTQALALKTSRTTEEDSIAALDLSCVLAATPAFQKIAERVLGILEIPLQYAACSDEEAEARYSREEQSKIFAFQLFVAEVFRAGEVHEQLLTALPGLRRS